MRVRYNGPISQVEVVVPGQPSVAVKRNGSAEVPDDVGKRLIEQADWSEVKASKAADEKPSSKKESDA